MTKLIEIIIPLAPAIAAAIWGYLKYADERDLSAYRDNVKDFFSTDKNVLLGSIATLGFYKERRRYKRNVIDILINRLYTELDYDVINAIVKELSQISTKNELFIVSQSLLDINRNFVIQKIPIRERKICVENVCLQAEKDYLEQIEKFENFGEEIVQQQKDYLATKRKDAQYLNDLHQYKLGWHRQVISDALAMLLLEGDRRDLTQDFSLNLYYNSIHSSQFFNIKLQSLYIEFSEFVSSSLQEITAQKIFIRDTFFGEDSLIRLCNFKSGEISEVEFIDSRIDGAVFENIEFKDVYFIRTELNCCTFRNVRGLDPLLFYSCTLYECQFDDNFEVGLVNSATQEEMRERLQKTPRSLFSKNLIVNAFNKKEDMKSDLNNNLR